MAPNDRKTHNGPSGLFHVIRGPSVDHGPGRFEFLFEEVCYQHGRKGIQMYHCECIHSHQRIKHL